MRFTPKILELISLYGRKRCLEKLRKFFFQLKSQDWFKTAAAPWHLENLCEEDLEVPFKELILDSILLNLSLFLTSLSCNYN